MKARGFTLIEVLIVVAIIGILASIALSGYQKHVARTQLTTAMAELRGAQPQYELIMSGISTSGNDAYTVENMFFASQSQICTYVVHPPVANVAVPALECQLKHVSPRLVGQSIFLNRSAVGQWSCSSSSGIDNALKPTGCS